MTVFLTIFCVGINEVKAPFKFDVEHGISLHAMQGNRASFQGEGEVSWFFLSCGGNLGYILECGRGWPFKTCFCSATSGLLSRCVGHLGIFLGVRQGNRDSSRSEAGDPVSLSSCHRDIGIPINFQEESVTISF